MLRRMVQKIVLFCFVLNLLFVIYAGFFFNIVPPQYTQNYQAAILDKMQRLSDIQEPKIILIGNSSVSFGIDSEMIEREFGMPVVNLGLHAGLGNKFLERMALGNISEGDIVIVAHTDYSDNGEIEQPDLAWITIENYGELWKLLDMREWMQILPALPNYIWQSTSLYVSGRGNRTSEEEYRRDMFNQYGDVANEREKRIFEFEDGMIKVPEVGRQCMRRLNALNSYCVEQNAVMLIAAYPIAAGEYTPDKQKYVSFQRKLIEHAECEVISDYTDYFIGYEYFYDTYYHLTSNGAEIRTERLIEDIRNWNQRVNFIDG